MEPYWHNEEHGLTIYHGDNKEVMLDIDTDSIDFCVTSPPYAQGLEYERGLDWDGLWNLIDETSSILYECMKPSAFCLCKLYPAGIYHTVPVGEWENIWTFRKPPNEKETSTLTQISMIGGKYEIRD